MKLCSCIFGDSRESLVSVGAVLVWVQVGQADPRASAYALLPLIYHTTDQKGFEVSDNVPCRHVESTRSSLLFFAPSCTTATAEVYLNTSDKT